MSGQRRETPLTVRFLDAAGRVIGSSSSQGSPLAEPVTPRAVPRKDRLAVILCDSDHVLAVVARSGVTVVMGLRDRREVLTADGWVGGLEVETDEGTVRPPSPTLYLACSECGNGAVFEVDAADVPRNRERTVRVGAKRVG